MGDATGNPGGGSGFYQAQRGWGPPQGAVSGRGGVWMPGQGNLQSVPGVSGGFYGPGGAGMSGSPDKMGAPMGGPSWQPQGMPQARGIYNPVNPMANTNPQAAGLQMLASGPSGPNFQPSWGNTAQAMGAGSVPGMGPQAGPTPPPAPGALAQNNPYGRTVPHPAGASMWDAPALNTSAEVQGAPAPAGPSRLELWQQKYKAMGTRPTANASFPAPPNRLRGGV